MSWPRILAMRHDDPDVLEGWLERLQADSVQRVGDLALTVNGGRFVETADGRAVGALRGLLFDDLEVAGWLDDRGHEVHADQHDRLAVDMVARFGPVGLARLRMQGVLACLLRGQGAVGMAGDAMGVGQLHFCRLQGGEVVASDHDLLNRLDGANRRAPALDDPARLWAGAATTHGETWRVPPGLLIVLGRGGVRFERLQRMETALPWLRHRPDWMQGADGSSVRGWLCGVLAEALAAAQRGVGPVVAGLATDRWQEAVCAMAKGHLHGAEHEDAARWSLSGIAGLFGDGSWPA